MKVVIRRLFHEKKTIINNRWTYVEDRQVKFHPESLRAQTAWRLLLGRQCFKHEREDRVQVFKFHKKTTLLRGHKTNVVQKILCKNNRQTLNYVSNNFRLETWVGEGREGIWSRLDCLPLVGKNCNFCALTTAPSPLHKIVSENAHFSICLKIGLYFLFKLRMK